MKKLLCGVCAALVPPIIGTLGTLVAFWIDQHQETAALIVLGALVLAAWSFLSYLIYKIMT